MINLTCFKSNDIRGQLGEELNKYNAYRIGAATAKFLTAKVIVVGGDNRLSTPILKQALKEGIKSRGGDVIDIGLCGTEEVYFATTYLKANGGIMITASHDPKNYNGMKIVREKSQPINNDTGLDEIKRIVASTETLSRKRHGRSIHLSVTPQYTEHILNSINVNKLKPLRLVVNAGNGVAGHVIDDIETMFASENVPIEFIKLHNKPDGNFPNGVPNPLDIENRVETSQAVKQHNADMGIAWDTDFDRCFFFDEQGNFIESYYIVGLLAQNFVKNNPDEKIVHDPRLTWSTIELVHKNGGRAIQSKTGHAFIKERMRQEQAIYGGEMSAHHYFRDFYYCDSGMIPWLLIAELMSVHQQKLSSLVSEQMIEYPSSGEINRQVDDPDSIINKIKNKLASKANSIENIDGLSMSFAQWRFNLRKSNNKSLLRLNIETRHDKALLQTKVASMLAMIDSH